MPRPRKCRKVCRFPQTALFLPADPSEAKPLIRLSVDEYETIRLIDQEGLSQEECSEWMQIARTTAQQIYANARKKLADMLVDGRPLCIGGGDYMLCDGQDGSCGACHRQTFHLMYVKPKGEMIMRIAVTYENGEIFQHFGHTEQFKIYDVQEGKIVSSEVVGTGGSGHGALAGVLHTLHADTLICGGIGHGAQAALAAENIRLYGGVTGNADEAVEALLAGKLLYNPDVHCDHHGEGHHHDSACKSHGCGRHLCGEDC
ncbi:MAG: DUF134 domain-containing protein [Lachnospiraceae bacterium]|uniref:DUF134 domain-containing protein n=1 Tax=Sporofaciens musculi TaxID=2681861 RepID=UPI00259C8C55|nr:DUF134 domain-containing protein [Sporofaciens musculi]MCI8455373.1 DUF134 domain-containing protein [Lachnospiraceae bacterium]